MVGGDCSKRFRLASSHHQLLLILHRSFFLFLQQVTGRLVPFLGRCLPCHLSLCHRGNNNSRLISSSRGFPLHTSCRHIVSSELVPVAVQVHVLNGFFACLRCDVCNQAVPRPLVPAIRSLLRCIFRLGNSSHSNSRRLATSPHLPHPRGKLRHLLGVLPVREKIVGTVCHVVCVCVCSLSLGQKSKKKLKWIMEALALQYAVFILYTVRFSYL